MRYKVPEPQPTEVQVLHRLVDDFAYAMKARLEETHQAGRRGWSNEEWTQSDIITIIVQKADQLKVRSWGREGSRDAVDLANLLAFLWNRRD